jgi:hypothetical protein
MSIQTAEQIIKADNARCWFYDYLRSHKNTIQRQSALQGIRGAIRLAIGVENSVELIEGRTRRDLSVSVNGEKPVRLSFYFA